MTFIPFLLPPVESSQPGSIVQPNLCVFLSYVLSSTSQAIWWTRSIVLHQDLRKWLNPNLIQNCRGVDIPAMLEKWNSLPLHAREIFWLAKNASLIYKAVAWTALLSRIFFSLHNSLDRHRKSQWLFHRVVYRKVDTPAFWRAQQHSPKMCFYEQPTSLER